MMHGLPGGFPGQTAPLSLKKIEEVKDRIEALAKKDSPNNMPKELVEASNYAQHYATLTDAQKQDPQEKQRHDQQVKAANDVLSKYEALLEARDEQKDRESSVSKSDNKVTLSSAGASFQASGSEYDLSSKHAARAKMIMENPKFGPLGTLGGILALLVMKLMNRKFKKTEEAFESAVAKLNANLKLTGASAYTVEKDTSGAAPRFIIKDGQGNEITDTHKLDLAKILKNEAISKGISFNFEGLVAAPAGNALSIGSRPVQGQQQNNLPQPNHQLTISNT